MFLFVGLVFFGMIIVALALMIFFLLTLYKALSRVSRRNRRMDPEKVFLWFIPFLHFYWSFRTISAVSDSLKREFSDRDADDGTDCAKYIGIIGQSLHVGAYVASVALSKVDIPIFRSVVMLVLFVAFVLWIIYWVRIADYSRRLQRLKDDDYDDEPDDLPLSRSSSPRDPGDGITKALGDDRIR